MNKDCLKKYGAIERPEIIIKGATEAWLNAKKQLDNEKERSIKNEEEIENTCSEAANSVEDAVEEVLEGLQENDVKTLVINNIAKENLVYDIVDLSVSILVPIVGPIIGAIIRHKGAKHVEEKYKEFIDFAE